MYAFFFFTDTTTTEIYTLSLHDALPISGSRKIGAGHYRHQFFHGRVRIFDDQDRKSTRLNSSHVSISYAVFCLKKKMRSSRNSAAAVAVAANRNAQDHNLRWYRLMPDAI